MRAVKLYMRKIGAKGNEEQKKKYGEGYSEEMRRRRNMRAVDNSLKDR